jgi:hypothetical protein
MLGEMGSVKDTYEKKAETRQLLKISVALEVPKVLASWVLVVLWSSSLDP